MNLDCRPCLWLSLAVVGVVALSAQGAVVADFDGDGRDDVLLRIDGTWHVYELEGLEVADGETQAPDLPRDEAWRVAGAGDLNGDGNDDLLFRHVDGAWHYYAMDGRLAITAESGAPALPASLEWSFAGIGDLNGDGNDDILLRHVSGRWLYHAAHGRHRIAAGRGLTLPRDLRLRFAGIGDLNGDGTDDVLLRHEDGRWFYHAVRLGRSALALGGWVDLPDNASFRFGGIGDLNGDGSGDVLLRGSGGQWHYYAMDGREVVDEASGGAEIPSGESWRLAGIGDLDGDGRDDVLLRSADGRWHLQAMDGRRSTAAHSGLLLDLPKTGSGHACGEARAASYVGRVAGFTGPGDDLEVVLTGRGALHAVQPGSDGCFAFGDVAPGRYAVKVNARGHRTTPARVVRFPFPNVHDGLAYDVETLPTDPFVYHWEEDPETPAGAEYSSHVVAPRAVEFEGAHGGRGGHGRRRPTPAGLQRAPGRRGLVAGARLPAAADHGVDPAAGPGSGAWRHAAGEPLAPGRRVHRRRHRGRRRGRRHPRGLDLDRRVRERRAAHGHRGRPARRVVLAAAAPRRGALRDRRWAEP